MKKYIKIILLIVIVIAIAVCVVYKIQDTPQPDNLEGVIDISDEYAKKDLGDDFVLGMVKHHAGNQTYLIGYTNSDDTHAIVYMLKPNVTGESWSVLGQSARKGSDASSLFSTW